MPRFADRLIIITAPSGSGKTTIVNHLLKVFPELSFSVSACTRKPRIGEQHGVNYYFLTLEEFESKIEQEAFAEYEMVYPGKYYGTLKSELERMWNEDKQPLVDIDVHGAMRLQKNYGDENTLSIFIKTPSIDELHKRLQARGTETEASLKERVQKAADELQYESKFDITIVNDQLQEALSQAEVCVKKFLNSKS